ncbi:hypothetical protein GCM10010392_13120 [Streptomyces clavifer]|nr:hypothetical protein GCM10010392_13120 [Streptomyces clavifer]
MNGTDRTGRLRNETSARCPVTVDAEVASSRGVPDADLMKHRPSSHYGGTAVSGRWPILLEGWDPPFAVTADAE